jgi:hypothetical protein
MSELAMFVLILRVLEVGASIITAMSLLAIAVHECTTPNGLIQRRRGKRK